MLDAIKTYHFARISGTMLAKTASWYRVIQRQTVFADTSPGHAHSCWRLCLQQCEQDTLFDFILLLNC